MSILWYTNRYSCAVSSLTSNNARYVGCFTSLCVCVLLGQQALAERQQLQEHNYQLQHRLAEYFRKKKSDDTRQDMDKNVTDQEQRYLKYMGELNKKLSHATLFLWQVGQSIHPIYMDQSAGHIYDIIRVYFKCLGEN